MTISKLSSGTKLSPNCSKPRSSRVCKFTPHYMAGNLSASQCGDLFLSPSRQASSNYGIGSDGTIMCYVDEDNRAWTSSSAWNDNQAVTVEVANISNDTGEITTAAWNSLVKLATDVCHRYGFTLNYTGTQDGSLTEHRMFSSTACPGPWLHSHMQELANQVNNNLKTGNYDASGTIAGLATSSGVVINDPAIAYALGINAKILFTQDEIYPFMVTISRNTRDDLDYSVLKDKDVIGVCIEMGSYFSASHTVNDVFRNPKLDAQVKAATEAKMPFGLYTEARARSVEEALDELYQIELAVRKYPPQMGLWLKLSFGSDSKSINDEILNTYLTRFVKIGLQDQIGLYCTRDALDKITWEQHYDDWYWWMDKHLGDVSNIHNLPTPKFFMYNDCNDELIEPDFAGAANAMIAGMSGAGATSGQDQGAINYNGMSNCYTYMGWQCITSVSSSQYKLRASAGQNFDSEGFGIINNRYVIASTSFFGDIGDYVDFTLANGSVLHCVIGDIKSSGDSNYSTIGHTYGNSVSVIEFVVDKSSWYYPMHANPGTSSCHPEWAGNLQRWAKCGSYW